MSGRTCIVTGGGTGLGLAIARRLARDGDDVVVVGRREEVLRDAVTTIDAEAGAGRARAEVADLGDPASVEALAERLPGRIDVLVLNAGGSLGGGPTVSDVAQAWSDTFRLNVLTAVLPFEALRDRLSEEDGRVLAVSSVAALRGAGAYGAMKGAINTWITGLAAELAPRRITVNAIAPGFVPDTEFWTGLTDEVRQSRLARIPMNRSASPDEVASLAASLVAPDAGFTTGQVVGIHGGTVLARL